MGPVFHELQINILGCPLGARVANPPGSNPIRPSRAGYWFPQTGLRHWHLAVSFPHLLLCLGPFCNVQLAICLDAQRWRIQRCRSGMLHSSKVVRVIAYSGEYHAGTYDSARVSKIYRIAKDNVPRGRCCAVNFILVSLIFLRVFQSAQSLWERECGSPRLFAVC